MFVHLLAAACAAFPAAAGVTPLVFHSSATFDSGAADTALAVAVDTQSQVFLAGVANNHFGLVKYDKRLKQLAARTFNAGGVETARGVALGPSGEVVLAGDDSTRMLIVKYDATLTFLSSATFTAPGGSGDKAQSVAIDASGNVVVAGFTTIGGVANVSVVRYDPSLRVLGSALFPGARGFGVALDASANVYVTGFSTGTVDFVTLKYSPTLGALVARHNLDLGLAEQGQAIAVDPAGRVAIVGHSVNVGAGTADLVVVRYDSSLVFVASASFSLGTFMQGRGIAFDPAGNVVVGGSTAQGDPSKIIGMRYSSALALISSATLQNQVSDHANAVAVDAKGNLFIGGDTNDGIQTDFTAVRFMGAPSVTTVQRSTQNVTNLLTVFGDNFAGQSGGLLFSSVTVSTPGMRVRGSAFDSVEQLRFSVDVASTVPFGFYPLTITNPDTSSTTLATGLEVVAVGTMTAAGTVYEFVGPGGPIRFTIPGGAFAGPFGIVVSSPPAVPMMNGGLIDTGLHFQVDETPAVPQPALDVTVQMAYRPQDVIGLDAETLVLAYFDPLLLQWVPLVSESNAGTRTVKAPTRHFTLWGLLSQPKAGDGFPVVIAPNPYKPGSGGPFDDGPAGKGILFRGMPSDFSLKIYSVLGRTVFEKNGTAVGGKFRWDASDNAGTPVPSGIYIAVIGRPGGEIVSKGKFGIIR